MGAGRHGQALCFGKEPFTTPGGCRSRAVLVSQGAGRHPQPQGPKTAHTRPPQCLWVGHPETAGLELVPGPVPLAPSLGVWQTLSVPHVSRSAGLPLDGAGGCSPRGATQRRERTRRKPQPSTSPLRGVSRHLCLPEAGALTREQQRRPPQPHSR